MMGFVIGGIYTFGLALAAFWFGYNVGQRSETNVLHDMRQSIKREKKNRTGPIKPMTKLERESKNKQFMKDFLDEL